MSRTKQIVIDYELWKQLKIASAQTEKSIKEIVEEAVQEHLKKMIKDVKGG